MLDSLDSWSKPMSTHKYWDTYSVFKVNEGGPGQKWAKYVAESLGADKVVKSPSVWVGQTAIEVFAGKRVHNRITKRLYR